MFDYICLDWGSKFVGLAQGSSITGIVLPYFKSIKNNEILDLLNEIVTQKHIKYIVVGYPTKFDGGKTEITIKVEHFIDMISDKFSTIKIIPYNERGTTKQAKKTLQITGSTSTNRVDNTSAAHILEDYFRYHLSL